MPAKSIYGKPQRSLFPMEHSLLLKTLNQLRLTAQAALTDGEPFVYFTIRKPEMPTGFRIHLGSHRGPLGEVTQITPVEGKPAVSARFRPAAVVLWCQHEAERLAG